MPRRALDVEDAGRQRGAGAAGAHERLRAAFGDGPRGLHDRGLGRCARGLHRVGRLGDRDRRVDDLDARGQLAELGRRAEQQHARALAGRERARRGDLAGSEVGAVAVDRDDRLLARRRAVAERTGPGVTAR